MSMFNIVFFLAIYTWTSSTSFYRTETLIMDGTTAKTVSEIFYDLFKFEAKERQLEAIITAIKNKNSTVFVALPTGFGKSMCYLALPGILDKVGLTLFTDEMTFWLITSLW